MPKKEEPRKYKVGPPVPFTFAKETEVTIPFERKPTGKQSHYRAALLELMLKKTEVLCFETNRCRSQLVVNAKKLELSVLFAEQGGKLYVKIDRAGSATRAVLEILQSGPLDVGAIQVELRRKGKAEGIELSKELQALSANGLIRLQSATGTWSATSAGMAKK